MAALFARARARAAPSTGGPILPSVPSPRDATTPDLDGPEAVADAEWARVRALAATVARLEAQEVEHGLDEAGVARLERARVRVARAAERALLADGLADRLAEMRPRERATPSGGAGG